MRIDLTVNHNHGVCENIYSIILARGVKISEIFDDKISFEKLSIQMET